MIFLALFRDENPIVCGGADMAAALENLKKHGIDARPWRLVEVQDAIVCAELAPRDDEDDPDRDDDAPEILEPTEPFSVFLEEVIAHHEALAPTSPAAPAAEQPATEGSTDEANEEKAADDAR